MFSSRHWELGRLIPNFFIFEYRVDLFRPRTWAVPPFPRRTTGYDSALLILLSANRTRRRTLMITYKSLRVIIFRNRRLRVEREDNTKITGRQMYQRYGESTGQPISYLTIDLFGKAEIYLGNSPLRLDIYNPYSVFSPVSSSVSFLFRCFNILSNNSSRFLKNGLIIKKPPGNVLSATITFLYPMNAGK